MKPVLQRVTQIHDNCKTWVRNSNGESYPAYYPNTLKFKPFQRALKQGKEVMAEVKKTNSKWVINYFKIVEPEEGEPVGFQSVDEQEKEYEDLCGDY
jgi:hypothetical protein